MPKDLSLNYYNEKARYDINRNLYDIYNCYNCTSILLQI